MRLATDHCAKLMNKINRNEMASINNATTDAPCTSYKSSFDIIINGAISDTSGTLPAIKLPSRIHQAIAQIPYLRHLLMQAIPPG